MVSPDFPIMGTRFLFERNIRNPPHSLSHSLSRWWWSSVVARVWESGLLWWLGTRICLPMQETGETQVQPLVQEDPLEESMPTPSSILAWRIPWTEKPGRLQFSSVQFSHSVTSDSLQPHESQHSKPPCPSPTPRVYSNSCPSSRWCHPAISSSVSPFSSCPQSLPASGFFPVSQLITLDGQSIGISASASVLPMNTQDWSPLGWTGWISLQSKGLSRVFSNTTVQKQQFFSAQLSSQSNSHIHLWQLEKPRTWLDGPLLAK